MKRLLQIVLRPVAVAVIGLVAMQPALACLMCRVPAAPCPMTITDVSPHCGAVSKADLDGSRHATSVRATSQSMASVAAPATRKTLVLAVADAPESAMPARAALTFVGGLTPARAESPPIYLRNRVFRI
jgi:hypothetical protein